MRPPALCRPCTRTAPAAPSSSRSGCRQVKHGTWYGVGAYAAWGLLPVYWKQAETVPATQLIGHRITWSFLILLAVIVASRQWKAFRDAIVRPDVLRVYALAA